MYATDEVLIKQYRLKLKVRQTKSLKGEKSNSQLLYTMAQTLKNGRILEAFYSGYGDSGGIEEILLDQKPISVIELADCSEYICASKMVYHLMNLISQHTQVFISFENGGCHGHLSVMELDNNLVVTCHHEYGEREHILHSELHEQVRIDHATLRHQKQLLEGQEVYPKTIKELCSLLWIFGITKLYAEKIHGSGDIELTLINSEYDCQEPYFEEQAQKIATQLIVNYLDQREDGHNLRELLAPFKSEIADRILNCDFKLKYEAVKGVPIVHIELTGAITEMPTAANPIQLILIFELLGSVSGRVFLTP